MKRRGAATLFALLVAAMATLVACLSDHNGSTSELPAPAASSDQPAFVREGQALVMAGSKPLHARFDADHRTIVRRSDGAAIAFSSTSIGRAGASLHRRASVAPTTRGERVEYAADGSVEWYERKPNGVEQGFTIAEREAGGGMLVVDIATAEDVG